MTFILVHIFLSIISKLQVASLFEDFIGNTQVLFHSFALIMIVLFEALLPFLWKASNVISAVGYLYIEILLKLWKQIKILFFCIWVLHLYIYIYIYNLSSFSGGEEWKIVADRLGFEDAYIRCFENRFKNPVELILNLSGLNVGELYDVLVECEFPLLADLL